MSERNISSDEYVQEINACSGGTNGDAAGSFPCKAPKYWHCIERDTWLAYITHSTRLVF